MRTAALPSAGSSAARMFTKSSTVKGGSKGAEAALEGIATGKVRLAAQPVGLPRPGEVKRTTDLNWRAGTFSGRSQEVTALLQVVE